MPSAAADRLARADIDGVRLAPLPRRFYPTGPLAGPVVGYTGAGQLVIPRLAVSTGTDGAGYFPVPAPVPARLPFADELDPIRAGMRAAVTGGTATSLARLPAPVAAKSGTAQAPHWAATMTTG